MTWAYEEGVRRVDTGVGMRVGSYRKLAAGLAVTAMLFGACGNGDGGAAGDIATDVGVTTEPCPDSENQDRGCIYLGVLSDLTEGPFRALAVPLTDGQEAFWNRVNAGEGIGGQFDVNITTYTRDNKYNPQEHVARLREILPNVLALAQSLGTPMTIAARDIMDENDLVAIPASWWSGWSFDELVLESGHNYCFEAMNGLDWYSEEYGEPDAILAVHYPGDYGGDHAAGAAAWAEANGVDFPEGNDVQTLPNAQAGNQDQAVGAILRASPDVVLLATGPAEAAEIIGKTAAQGFEGRFVGAAPTYNPAVLQSEAAPAIIASYNFTGPWAPWGADTGAHQAMVEAVGDDLPANEGFTSGWIWSYPMKALLEQAVADGDLTRAALRERIDQITVDYEGALPRRNYTGDPDNLAFRQSVIGVPDPDAPLGSSTLRDFEAGATVAEYDFTEPCQAL